MWNSSEPCSVQLITADRHNQTITMIQGKKGQRYKYNTQSKKLFILSWFKGSFTEVRVALDHLGKISRVPSSREEGRIF